MTLKHKSIFKTHSTKFHTQLSNAAESVFRKLHGSLKIKEKCQRLSRNCDHPGRVNDLAQNTDSETELTGGSGSPLHIASQSANL